MPNRNNGVKSTNLKLNAQWLKNAARTLGMNGISTLADISPNAADVGRMAASSINTVTNATKNIRRQQRPIQYLLESNKYVKLGKRAIDNALSDLAKGKFSNQDRSSGGDAMGETSTGTYFGDMSDGSDGSGETSGQTVQNIFHVDTKAIDNVSNAVNTQTKYQLQMGKANIDTMVAISASSMTQQQKNADAVLAQVTEMNRGIQSLVAYQNENMTKFISASMAYYEAAGKQLGAGGSNGSTPTAGASVIGENGGLNLSAYSERAKKQMMGAFQGTTAGMLLQMLAENGDDLANNPMEFVSKAVMEKAIPDITKKAMKATDQVFGSFMSEMLLQMGDKWEADTSDGILGKAKRFAAKAFGINDKRKDKITRSGKINNEAAVFDNMTKTAITDELPRYARESTSYLRSIVELLGGDPNDALRGSRILNRETGRYQSMESFAQEFSSSIDQQVINAMDKSSFGKELRNMATSTGKTDEQIKRLNEAIDKFYVAAEKNTKGSIDIKNIGEGSEMSALIKETGLDANMQKFLEKSIANMMKYQKGMESFNEGRQRARRSRNTRIDEIGTDTGMMRTSNLFRSGVGEDIDVAQITADNLLPQRRGKGGINLPAQRRQGLGAAVADALYGNSSAKLIGGANPRSMAIGSVGARLKTIEDILLRGVNVRIDNNRPWIGAEDVGRPKAASSRTQYDAPIGPQLAATPESQAEDDVDLSNIDEVAENTLGGSKPPATGRGSKTANTLEHAKNAMYLMMTGNASLAMNEMSTMLGETVSNVAKSAKEHILEPIKDAILPKKETKDENGNTITERMSLLDIVKEKFTGVTDSVKKSFFGTDEEGKAKPISTIFKEGMGEWKKTIFGDKDPEEIKKKIQERVPDAVGGAMGGGLIGLMVGGPVFGALLGGAAGFAKKSQWFQDMMFGKVDEDGKEIKKGLIPPQVKKYYEENKQSLTGAAAAGGLIGLVMGGPVVGAALGVGASILKKSTKFNELLFGKEETDEKTGATKKVGGILNLFKEVGGHYWKGTSNNMKGLSSKAAVGAAGGLLLSLFTPIGPVGGAAMGLAASIATNGDKFKQFLFGKKNENGELEEAGLFQKLGNDVTAHVINPLRDGILDFFDKSKDKVIDKMLSPMLAALQPLLNLGGRIYEKTLGKIAEGANKAGEMFTALLRRVGNALWKRTFGRAGKFLKKTAGAAVSVATRTVGGGFKKLGNFAEKSNRKASLKRFNKEEKLGEHSKLIEKWTEEYNNNPALQTKPLEKYLDDMRSRHYYNYGEKIKDYFGTDEERAQKRKETEERAAQRARATKQSKLIDDLTGGKFSDTSATAKQAALDAYMKTKQYVSGNKLRVKGVGKMSQEDILELLKVDKSEDEKIAAEQTKVLDEQLEYQREAAGSLGKIYDWMVTIGNKITGADNPERQEHKAQKQAQKEENKAQKQAQKDEKKNEAAKRKTAYEEALRSTAESTASSDEVKYEQLATQAANRWKTAEKEILEGLNSKNPTIKKAAKKAYPAFFDENGNRIIGADLTRREIRNISIAKRNAYYEFKQAVNSKQATITQEGRLQSGLLGKTIGRLPGMGLLDKGLGKLRAAKGYIVQSKHHAVGGDAAEGEVAVVGEHGPEIVQFANRSRVLPNSHQLNVNVVGMSPDVANMVTSDTAIQDVRIVGQNGLLATYGTSAKLGSKTNNPGKVKEDLEDPNSLIDYDTVAQDNNDYEGEGEGGEGRTPSLLEKILGLFGGKGGILSTLGLIAGGTGVASILLGDDFSKLIDGFFEKQLGSESKLGKFIGAIGAGLSVIGRIGAPVVNTVTKAVQWVAGKIPGVGPELTGALGNLQIEGEGASAGLQTIGLGGLYLKGANAVASGISAIASVAQTVSNGVSSGLDLLSKIPGGGKYGKWLKIGAGALALGTAGYSYLKGPETHENTDAAGNEIVDVSATQAKRSSGTHLAAQLGREGLERYVQGAAGRTFTRQLTAAGLDATTNAAGKTFIKNGNKFATNAAIEAATGSSANAVKTSISHAAVSTADDAASSKGAMGFIKKILGKIKDFLMKNKKLSSISKTIGSKMDDIIGLLGKKAQKLLDKMPAKVASIITKGGTKEAASVATAGIGYAVMAFGGALSGGLSAANIFGVREADVDPLMTTIASVIVAMLNAVPGMWALELVDLVLEPLAGTTFRELICQFLYSALGGAEDLASKQATFGEDLNVYNEKFGAQLSVDEYNDMVNMTAGSKIFGKGAVKTDASGRAMFDEAGEALRTNHGIAGWFATGGEKQYAHDANGNIVRDAEGNAVQAIDAKGHKMYKEGEKRWTGHVGDWFHDVGGWFAGKKTYKLDENGNVMYDENGKPIVESQEDNVLKRGWNATKQGFSTAKQWVGDRWNDTKDAVGKGLKWAKGTASFALGKADDFVEALPGIGSLYKGVKNAVGNIPDVLNKIGDGVKTFGGKIKDGIGVVADKTKEIAGNVKDWAANKFNWVKDKAGAVVDGAKDMAGKVGDWFGDRFHDAKNLLESGVSAVKDKLAPVTNALSTAGEAIGKGFNTAIDGLKGAAGWVGDKFKAVGSTLKDVGSWLGDKAKGIASWVGDVGKGIGGWFGDRLEDVKSLASGAADWIGDKWNNAKDFGSKALGLLTAPFKDAMNVVTSTPDDYETYMKDYMATGGKGGRGNIIPFYSQKDPRWAGRPYDQSNTETMYDAGCGPTALSMAVNGAGGMGPTPIDAADRLRSIGARDATGTSWSGMDRGIRSYGLESDQTTNPGENFVDSGLSSGKPVILSGTSRDSDDPFTSQGHYVVVSGKDRKGNYVVNDPNESAPVTYSKEQVTRNAAKGWKVGGGRGKLRPVKGGGRIESAVNAVALNDGGGGVSKEAQLKAAKEKWINIIKAVKQAIAQQHPGYSQSNWINITVGGKELSVRTDCSGFVGACLKYMGMMQDKQNISTRNTNNPNDSIMTATGFKPSSFSGWDTLEPGDIVSRSGHVEIFARNDGNTHYVWNCGSNDSVNNPNETRTGGKGYDYVWRLGEAAPGGINSFDVSGSSSGYTSGTTATTDSSSSSGGFFSKLASWATSLGQRAVGWLTGDMSLEQATDWSNWQNGGTTASSEASGYSSSGYTGSSGASSANLSPTEVQKRVWKRLRKEGPYTPEGTAGVMGNLFAESGVQSNNVQNSCESRVGSDTVYTAKVDDGSYTRDQFSSDSAGYGLAQWTSAGRKRGLYDLAKSKGVSIADPDMQVDHLLNELKTSYKGIHEMLTKTTDVAEASYKVMHDFEAPAARDSAETKRKREGFAISMLDNYKGLDSESGGGSTHVSGLNEKPSTAVTMTAMGGRGGRGTASHYKGSWKYNTNAIPSKGSSRAYGETLHGSSAPINFTAHEVTRQRRSGGRGPDESTAVNLLKQIVEILRSSDGKLNNLSYLSEIGSLGQGGPTNNIMSFNTDNTTNQTTKNGGGISKIHKTGYEDAKRITAG